MKINDIAKRGLKGRKKDTLLLKLVITLAFIFIVTSTVFESSIDKTKLEQRLDLYGEWHAAYLKGDKETLDKLKAEPMVDKVGSSLILGESEKCGIIGTFNEDLIDMSRFSLYKGRYPEAPNEIMLELNQMSNMNLDLEVGQKVQVAIPIQRVQQDYRDYIMNLNREFYERRASAPRAAFWDELNSLHEEMEILITKEAETDEEKEKNKIRIREIEGRIDQIYNEHFFEMKVGSPDYYQHHETPFEQMGDVSVVVSNNYFYYYMTGDEVNPDIIREKGLLTSSKVILKKEFIVTGILQTYTDKWDLGGYKAPNALITEEGGKTLTDAFYGTSIGDFSDYKMDYNIFLYSDSEKDELYSTLKSRYPNMEMPIKEEEKGMVRGFHFWLSMYGQSDEYIEKALEESNKWIVGRKPDEWRDDSLEGKEEIGSKMEVNNANFRKNIFSYPDDAGSTEYVLMLTIIAVIFIATALAIFQIFLTQMKRRARKIVLLKSIGSTNTQIVKMLIYEGLYLLRTGLFVGVPTGFGLAAIIVYSMNTFGGRDIRFHVIPLFLVVGILAGCLALFIGMAVPMIFAIRIPLVGTMSKPPKHKKIKHKDNNKKVHRQTFKRINWQYFKLNKGKTLISFGISLITITILLSTVLLCYISFDNYRSTVLEKNRPDYAMEAYFGEATRGIRSMDEELLEIDGIKSTEVYKVGKQVFLWYEGIENNNILNTFEDLLPSKFHTSHFSKYIDGLDDFPEWITNSFFTKIFSIDPDGELFNKYNSLVKTGEININKFKKGEEVILLVPLYFSQDENIVEGPFNEKLVLDATNEDNRMNWMFEQTDNHKTTYSSRYKDYYKKHDDIKPGDVIHLSVDKEEIVGDAYASGFRTKEFTVGGIIYYFEEEQIWPFSNNTAPYIVISSMDAMESLYPNSRLGLGMNSFEQMKVMVDVLYPTKYGRTLWYINTDSRAKDVVLDSKLLAYANNNGYILYNYKESNAELYQEALNNAIIIGLLGFTSAAIACIILYNILVSKLEQDKNRIGILQALGVTNREFSRHYTQIGVLNGLASIILVNILLIIVMLLTSIAGADGIQMEFGGYIKDILTFRLWQYPWIIHGIISIMFFILTVLMYYLPSKKITDKYPVENIRSLGR